MWYAKPGGWYDDNTPMQLFFKIPFTNWGSWGGLRTSQFPMTENYPVGEKYWSTWMCSFDDFYFIPKDTSTG